jgi:hypothetical protein
VLVAWTGDAVVGVASVLLLCAYAPPDSVSAATTAINALVGLFMTRSSFDWTWISTQRFIRSPPSSEADLRDRHLIQANDALYVSIRSSDAR